MSKREKPWMFKAPWTLKEKLDKIRIDRIKAGKDKQMTSYKRLGLAISRHETLLKDLANADLVEDKNAQINIFSTFNVFTFMITAFVAILFFGGLIYAQGLLANTFHQVGINNEVNAGHAMYVNMTAAADLTFGQVANSIKALQMVAAVYIFVLAIAIVICNALAKVHSMWFFVYILISILAIVTSVPISNAYQTILNEDAIFKLPGATHSGLFDFGVSNWFMINLPTIVMFVSILGGIFLFINIVRTGENNLT